MSAVKIEYGASAALTITLASLATSSTLLVGRQSTAIDNATDKYLDFLVGGKITTGTSPTANKQIEILAFGSLNDTPLYPDTLGAADAGVTLTNTGNKLAVVIPLVTIPTTSSSNITYFFGPFSLAKLFGAMPKKWGIFVTHNTGADLHATGSNHALYFVPVYATSI